MSESEHGAARGGVTPHATPGAPGGGARQLVGFHLGGVRFAVDIARVHEIVKPPPLTPVPEMPPDFAGVIRLRDEVIVVADLRARFGMPDAVEGGASHVVILAAADRKVGVAVDAVSDVVRLREGMLSPSPEFHGGVPVACVDGIARVGEDLVTVLDVDALFPPRGPYGEEPLDDLEDLFADPPPEALACAAEAPAAAPPEPPAEPAPEPAPPTPAASAPDAPPPAEPEAPVAGPAPDPAPEPGAALYREIGSLARYIHRVHLSFADGTQPPEPPPPVETAANFRPRDLPSANDVLTKVTQETEVATMQVMANTEETVGAVTHLFALLAHLEDAVPADGDGRAAARELADRMRAELDRVQTLQNDTLTALSFQDITGQKIKEVIALMAEVEERVLGLVVAYGSAGADRTTEAAGRIRDLKQAPEGGPLRQDRVDDLLAEFGF